MSLGFRAPKCAIEDCLCRPISKKVTFIKMLPKTEKKKSKMKLLTCFFILVLLFLSKIQSVDPLFKTFLHSTASDQNLQSPFNTTHTTESLTFFITKYKDLFVELLNFGVLSAHNIHVTKYVLGWCVTFNNISHQIVFNLQSRVEHLLGCRNMLNLTDFNVLF